MTNIALNLTTPDLGASWTGTIGIGSTVTLNAPANSAVGSYLYKSVPTTTTLLGTYSLVGTITLKTSWDHESGYSNVGIDGYGEEFTGGQASAISSFVVKQGASIIASYSGQDVPSYAWYDTNAGSSSTVVYLNLTGITNLSTLSIEYTTTEDITTGTLVTWVNGGRSSVEEPIDIGPVSANIVAYDLYLTGSAVLPSLTSFVSNTLTAPKSTPVYLTAVFANGTANVYPRTAPYNVGNFTLTSGVPYMVVLPPAALTMQYEVVVSDGVNLAYDQTSSVYIVVTAEATLAGDIITNKTIATQNTNVLLTATFGNGLTGSIDNGVGAVTSGVAKTVTLPNTAGNVTYTLTVDNGVSSAAVDSVTILATAPSVNKYVPNTPVKAHGPVAYNNLVWTPELWDEDISNHGHYPKDSADPSTISYTVSDAVSASNKEYYYFAGSVLQAGDAPAITVNPLTSSKQETQSVSFICSAVGSSPMTFTWYRNSTLYSTDTSPTFDGVQYTSTATKTGLTIATDNASTWYCEASNSIGLATSTTATLTVTALVGGPVLPNIYYGVYNVTAALDSSVTMECYIASNAHNPIMESVAYAADLAAMTIEWFENGVSVGAGTRVTEGMWNDALHATLTFTGSSGKDGHTFYAEVTNDAGTSTSATGTLTLVLAPYAPTTLSNASVNEGVNFTLGPVSASGPGPFTYQWYQTWVDTLNLSVANVPLTGGGGTTNTYTQAAKWAWPSYLTFGAPDANLAHFYCKISNAAGWVSTNAATITTIPVAVAAPVLVTSPSNYTKTEGQDVTFTASFSGLVSGYHWAGNNDMWGANYSTPSKTLTALTLSQSGTDYTCTAWNSFG
ncbi:MAG: immunoglobulin domain-containing protein, partial [Ignisphaera sp.]|nr:immunoglobulin domain-containing protein [Ignisphaera sp.]